MMTIDIGNRMARFLDWSMSKKLFYQLGKSMFLNKCYPIREEYSNMEEEMQYLSGIIIKL